MKHWSENELMRAVSWLYPCVICLHYKSICTFRQYFSFLCTIWHSIAGYSLYVAIKRANALLNSLLMHL